MPAIEIQLPSLLTQVLKERNLTVEGETLQSVFDNIVRDHPTLALHLFDEDGGLRPHVLCFLNQTNTRWLDDSDKPLAATDTLLFMQAVSGG